MYIFMYGREYAGLHDFTCVHVCTYVCTRVCMRARMHVLVRMCMCRHLYIYRSQDLCYHSFALHLSFGKNEKAALVILRPNVSNS